MSAEPRRRVFRWRSGMPTPEGDLRWLSWPEAERHPWRRCLVRVQGVLPMLGVGAVWFELYDLRWPLVDTPVGILPRDMRPVDGLTARLSLN